MYVVLRRLALWILAAEIEERVAHARKLSTRAYVGGPGRVDGGKRGRAWWSGYEQALVALRESRRGL